MRMLPRRDAGVQASHLALLARICARALEFPSSSTQCGSGAAGLAGATPASRMFGGFRGRPVADFASSERESAAVMLCRAFGQSLPIESADADLQSGPDRNTLTSLR